MVPAGRRWCLRVSMFDKGPQLVSDPACLRPPWPSKRRQRCLFAPRRSSAPGATGAPTVEGDPFLIKPCPSELTGKLVLLPARLVQHWAARNCLQMNRSGWSLVAAATDYAIYRRLTGRA